MNVRDIPDPAALGFRSPKWSKAQQEYDRLQRERTQTLAMRGELRTRLGTAQDADSTAYATALRQGKPDPGTPQVDAVKAEQAALERRAAAMDIAVQQAGAELVQAVESERDALLAEAEQAVRDRRATLQAVVESWAEARTELAEAIALTEYLRDWPNGRFKIGSGYLRVPRGGDGLPPPTADATLAMLRQDAAAPVAPKEPPAYAGPLLPRVEAVGVSGSPLRD